MIQRQERSTPYKPHPPPHLTGTKRSLYRDLEKQFLASRRISDTDDDAGSMSQENRDPVPASTPSKYPCDSLAFADKEVLGPANIMSRQVSVIRKAPSSIVEISNSTPLQKRSGFLVEISDNHQAMVSCTSPKKLPRKQAEQEARYVSALALIELAQGQCS